MVGTSSPSSPAPGTSVASVAAVDFPVRSIHELLPSNSVPPFTLTAIVLLAVILFVATTRRKNRVEDVEESPSEALRKLREEYECRHLPLILVVERAALIVRGAVAGAGADSMTSEEIIARSDSLPPGTLRLAEAFLYTCDLVRFGGHSPDAQLVERLLREGVQVVDQTGRGEQ